MSNFLSLDEPVGRHETIAHTTGCYQTLSGMNVSRIGWRQSVRQEQAHDSHRNDQRSFCSIRWMSASLGDRSPTRRARARPHSPPRIRVARPAAGQMRRVSRRSKRFIRAFGDGITHFGLQSLEVEGDFAGRAESAACIDRVRWNCDRGVTSSNTRLMCWLCCDFGGVRRTSVRGWQKERASVEPVHHPDHVSRGQTTGSQCRFGSVGLERGSSAHVCLLWAGSLGAVDKSLLGMDRNAAWNVEPVEREREPQDLEWDIPKNEQTLQPTK